MFLLCFGVIVFSGLSYGIPHSKPRIHGGVDAPPGAAPHMVALLRGDRLVVVVCGGSVISSRHVLTAAHCITPFVEDELVPTLHGRVGSHIWHTGGALIQFKDYFIHPKWDERIIKYDVGILSLKQDLVFSEGVAVMGLDFGWVEGGRDMAVSRWGTTEMRIEENVVHLAPTPDHLQKLSVRTLAPAQCAEAMTATAEWAAVAPPLDPNIEIRTFHSVGHGMCHGDSGSALVSVASGLQAGIVSWGMPCAAGAPDVHTQLRGVRDFIEHVLSDITRHAK